MGLGSWRGPSVTLSCRDGVEWLQGGGHDSQSSQAENQSGGRGGRASQSSAERISARGGGKGTQRTEGGGAGSACLYQGARHSFCPLPAENEKEHRRNMPGGLLGSGPGEVWSPRINSSSPLMRIWDGPHLTSSGARLPGYTARALRTAALVEARLLCGISSMQQLS